MKSNTHKTFKISKKAAFFVFLLLCMFTPMFAANDLTSQIDTVSENILDLIGGNTVKIILLLVLIGEAIGVVFMGRQGGGGEIIKKFFPWIVGTIILLCACSIVGFMTEDLDLTDFAYLVDSVENTLV